MEAEVPHEMYLLKMRPANSQGNQAPGEEEEEEEEAAAAVVVVLSHSRLLNHRPKILELGEAEEEGLHLMWYLQAQMGEVAEIN